MTEPSTRAAVDRVPQLSLDEKASLVIGPDFWHTAAV